MCDDVPTYYLLDCYRTSRRNTVLISLCSLLRISFVLLYFVSLRRVHCCIVLLSRLRSLVYHDCLTFVFTGLRR
jgi:hypothetical protein